jgi:hypothetical protein
MAQRHSIAEARCGRSQSVRPKKTKATPSKIKEDDSICSDREVPNLLVLGDTRDGSSI